MDALIGLGGMGARASELRGRILELDAEVREVPSTIDALVRLAQGHFEGRAFNEFWRAVALAQGGAVDFFRKRETLREFKEDFASLVQDAIAAGGRPLDAVFDAAHDPGQEVVRRTLVPVNRVEGDDPWQRLLETEGPEAVEAEREREAMQHWLYEIGEVDAPPGRRLVEVTREEEVRALVSESERLVARALRDPEFAASYESIRTAARSREGVGYPVDGQISPSRWRDWLTRASDGFAEMLRSKRVFDVLRDVPDEYVVMMVRITVMLATGAVSGGTLVLPFPVGV